MSGALLALRGVSAGYGPRTVLRDVDLAVEAGERVAIVGPNGAGKSTLLRLMTGVLAPTSGEVEVDGRSLTTMDRDAIPEFQSFFLVMRYEDRRYLDGL